MRRRATRRRLAHLAAAELGQVRGGINILMPSLGKARNGSEAPMTETIGVVFHNITWE